MNKLSVGQAQDIVLEIAASGANGKTEEVGIAQTLGRVLAEDVYANRDLPPYDVSAMDGFAVRSADLAATGAVLTVVEDIKAGDMPKRPVGPGECSRIMTGAPVPAGADAVVRVEDTRIEADGRIAFQVTTSAGNDIRQRGEAMKNGDVILPAGTEVTPGVVGVLATAKRARVKAVRRPTVAILSTGDELEALEAPFDPNKIPESNSYALMAQVQALGIEPVRLGIAPDEPQALAALIERGLAYDVLLVSGGSSVGVHDHVRPTLEALGVAMHFWRVEMKPGHPVAFGSRGDRLVFGLPGNPVSSMVCFEQFVVPALRRRMGAARLFRRTLSATLTHPVKHRPGRAEFVRVTLESDGEGGYRATSTGSQSSGDLKSMARADGLLAIPENYHGLVDGERATVQLLDGTTYQAAAGLENDE